MGIGEEQRLSCISILLLSWNTVYLWEKKIGHSSRLEVVHWNWKRRSL